MCPRSSEEVDRTRIGQPPERCGQRAAGGVLGAGPHRTSVFIGGKFAQIRICITGEFRAAGAPETQPGIERSQRVGVIQLCGQYWRYTQSQQVRAAFGRKPIQHIQHW